jgi:hypothetical protein
MICVTSLFSLAVTLKAKYERRIMLLHLDNESPSTVVDLDVRGELWSTVHSDVLTRFLPCIDSQGQTCEAYLLE